LQELRIGDLAPPFSKGGYAGGKTALLCEVVLLGKLIVTLHYALACFPYFIDQNSY
jgi:hypothetical protein